MRCRLCRFSLAEQVPQRWGLKGELTKVFRREPLVRFQAKSVDLLLTKRNSRNC